MFSEHDDLLGSYIKIKNIQEKRAKVSSPLSLSFCHFPSTKKIKFPNVLLTSNPFHAYEIKQVNDEFLS